MIRLGAARKPSWSRGRVRDVNVCLIDTLALGSWLWSSTTTDRFTDTARSSTVYDTHCCDTQTNLMSSLVQGCHSQLLSEVIWE